MTFSEDAWAGNLALYEAARDLPFNTELGAGTLPIEKFRHYIVQDAYYLVAFAQALALVAAKADEPDQIAQFAQSAAGAVVVERSLHTEFFHRFGLSPGKIRETPVSPTCHHYVSFLVATCFREPLGVALAALLPCFWVYREVGRHLLAAPTSCNPYQAWIDTYGGAEFSDAVDRMIATADTVAAAGSDTGAMRRAFTRATQLEWMFWDSAYRLECWPI